MTGNLYRNLLKEYCDALISVQDKREDKAFRGGIWCRSCKMIHGRCPDSVFGLTVMAKISGEEKYLQAAKDVFSYGDNMFCDDGSMYNDAQAAWLYTTTFHEISVLEALRAGKNLLDAETKIVFEQRAKAMAVWLYDNLDENAPANINYATSNGWALFLAGNYFQNERYLQRARRLIDYAMKHISQSGFLYGESKPHDKRSEKECYSVDIGYNVEESLPALVKYCCEVGDESLKQKILPIVETHLKFMFPDGGWDNSFGNRNNKWTYWGSRTSDGCSPMFLLLADRNPAFAEAALRNTEMLAKCSVDGFLYGGPHYHKHGEYPCTHHLIEHVNALAFAVEYVDEKYLTPKRTSIPADRENVFEYYPEIRTYKMTKGKYQATVTDYDFDIFFSGHATGGTLTALYHKEKGPMIMGSVTEYVLIEPTNMQLPLEKKNHRSLLPRLIYEDGNERYSSTFYLHAEICGEAGKTSHSVSVTTGLSTNNGKVLEGVSPSVTYTVDEKGCNIAIRKAKNLKFILPLIAGEIRLRKGKIEKQEEIFFLTGGFIAQEYTVVPDENGEIETWIF